MQQKYGKVNIFIHLNRRLQSFEELKKSKWLQDCDWESISSKAIVSPVVIDLNVSNIHEEFLEIDIYPEKFQENENL